ncbi:uncharacterized protein C1orf159 homolog isoform X1 [Brienomyrus brachyistius]|uniref:uncharacterized protein C1orf159 homolog isoform X1 n=1 Tax=Brienomyrus brachyistius TaxID=42636 RepID=UPI0020B2E0E6|nr:uncharacterized protein C1orf159 homolog isoform X1 [Brienomyrus brachyistius]
MALPYLVFTGALLQVVCETSVNKTFMLAPSDNGGEAVPRNGTCFNSTWCPPGCSLQILENASALCVQCDTVVFRHENLTTCNYSHIPPEVNLTMLATVGPKIGGPGVAASLLLGTLLLSLLLILSVASFFYLKRSNRLPGLFYRRNKAFIFQPSETAVMIPSPASSGRKPRYVRRERPSVTTASTAVTISTTAITKVSNV